MRTLKNKSFVPEVEDEQVEREFMTVSFISFERAIENELSMTGERKKPKGYSVTEQGILIRW